MRDYYQVTREATGFALPSGEESAQRATTEESCYEGGAKPVASRVKPDSNAITTAAFAICNGKQ